MKCNQGAYIGDVTALTSFRFLLDDDSASRDLCFAGDSWNSDQASYSKLVFDTHLWRSLCSVQWTPDTVEGFGFKECASMYSSLYWILAAEFHPYLDFAFVGLSNNSVQILMLDKDENTNAFNAFQELCCIECSLKTFLFSMSIILKEDPVDEMTGLVASGTAFNDIAVWKFSFSSKRVINMLPEKPCLCLKAHSGGILRLRWCEDGTSLLSASEDRTFALWRIPEDVVDDETRPVFRRFGHKARIWDVMQTQDQIITCSEDCSFRIWNAQNGDLLTSVKGHVGRGIWRCALTPNNSLITAGADGAILCWPGITTSPQSSQMEQHTMKLQVSVTCLKLSKSWLDRIYFCSDEGSILTKRISSPLGDDYENKICHNFSLSGSFVCSSVETVSFGEDLVFDLFVAGHSKGAILMFLINSNGETTEQRPLIETPNGKPVLALSCQSVSRHQHFLVSAGDCEGSMICYSMMLMPNSSSYFPQNISSFILSSPLKTRLVCVLHVVQEDVHFAVGGDTHGSIVAWRIQNQEHQAVVEVSSVFKGIHGKQPIGMIRQNPLTKIIYSAARNYSIQEFFIEEETRLRPGSEIRLRHISTAEYLEIGAHHFLIGGFCSQDFCLVDLTASQLLMRVEAGGRNRIHDFYSRQSTACFVSVDKNTLHCIKSNLDAASSADLRSYCLHPGHHGDEINSIITVMTPKGGDILCLTAGEDSKVKAVIYSKSRLRFQTFKDVGSAAGGTSIKALTIVKLNNSFDGSSIARPASDDYLCVSVGSKQVIMTWVLSISSAENGNVSSRLLAKKVPSRGGLRPSSMHQEVLLKSDLRYIAATLITEDCTDTFPELFLIVSSSDSSLTGHSFDMEQKQWNESFAFVHHKSPVLCLDHIKCPAADSKYQMLVASGSTNGTLCLWSLSRNFSSTAEYSPVAFVESLHQSGINTLSFLPPQSPSQALLLATGGDDQSIIILSITQVPTINWNISLLQSIPNAHTSSVRAVCAHTNSLFSIGLDQRLIFWQLTQDHYLQSNEHVHSEVASPSALSISSCSDGVFVLVCGHGLQIFKFH